MLLCVLNLSRIAHNARHELAKLKMSFICNKLDHLRLQSTRKIFGVLLPSNHYFMLEWQNV